MTHNEESTTTSAEAAEALVFRHARKQYECCGDGSAGRRHARDCPGVILPGEKHFEYLGETPAYQSGPRLTLACAREFWAAEPPR